MLKADKVRGLFWEKRLDPFMPYSRTKARTSVLHFLWTATLAVDKTTTLT